MKVTNISMNNTSTRILSALIIAGFIFVVFSFSFASAVGPSGASVTAQTPQTAAADAAGTADAYAGNITGLGLVGYTTTQTWQGYFGNVSGTIQLADAADNVLYNWSLAEPSGEVYASINSSINWGTIQCFNFTARGSHIAAAGESPGGTNLNGTNLSTLESNFGILYDDVDGVNETFTLSGAGTHDAFFTASQQFTEGECRSTRLYGSTGTGVNNEYEEVLMYEPISTSIVYASLLEEGALTGFNGQDNDFEMLVLENGHGTNVALTVYNFFVELE